MEYSLDGVLSPLSDEALGRVVFSVLSHNKRLQEWDRSHPNGYAARQGYDPRPSPGHYVKVSGDAIDRLQQSLERDGRFCELIVLHQYLGDAPKAMEYERQWKRPDHEISTEYRNEALNTIDALTKAKWWSLAQELALEIGRADLAAEYAEELMKTDIARQAVHRADARELRRRAGHYPRALELTDPDDLSTRYALLEEHGNFVTAAREARKNNDAPRAEAYETIARALGDYVPEIPKK